MLKLIFARTTLLHAILLVMMDRQPISKRYLPRLVLGLGLLGATLASCASQGGENSPKELEKFFNHDWATHQWWDDGLAEVATYTAERVIYNKKRSFDYTLITVKEDFNKAYDVKTDDYERKDLFPVMKVNQFCRIPTDNYPYHFLTSLFFRRENPVSLYKLTSSSQEWCGNTFKAIVQAGNRLEYAYDSYWDGQGRGKMDLNRDLLIEDQLPYTLRSLKFTEGLVFSAQVAGLIQTNKAGAPEIYPATFRVTGGQAAGRPVWQVSVRFSPEKQNAYWFARDYPHVLVQQQTWDGRSLQLKEVKRYAYWQH
jgi:hypothetical protein